MLTFETPAAATGGNQTVCVGGTSAGLGGTVSGGATGGVWSSSGTGAFAPNTTTLNATYHPSAADIAAGTVTLTLTCTGQPAACGPASAQVVLTIRQLLAAPTTTGATICGTGVAQLSASGSGGTLNWYSDAGLTHLVNTGPTYAPTVSSGTTYYVTETSGTGCVSPASPVSVVVNNPATVSAGADLNMSGMASSVTLAGSFGGGATGGIWSGGAGTFTPNNTALNATYAPTANEIAAGSLNLTLSSTGQAAPCGTVSDTVTITFNPQLTLPVISSSSTLSLQVNADITYLSLGSGSAIQTTELQGTVTVQLDENGNPAYIALEDYAWEPINDQPLTLSMTIGSLITATANATANHVRLFDSSPGSGTFVPISGGAFSMPAVPYHVTTELDYNINAAGVYTANGVYDADETGTLPMTGTCTSSGGAVSVMLHVSNFQIPFNFSGYGTATITLNGTINSVGSSGVPQNLTWNDGASTFNWNTTDANWTGKLWDNLAPDNAIFGATGVGTVNLTMPISVGAITFNSAGYTLAGNTLTLAKAQVITNNANATISSAIVSGALNLYGGSMLTLSGANTYAGGTIVNGGTLQISSDGQLGSVPGSAGVNLTLNGAELFNNGGALSLNANRSVSLGSGGGYIEPGWSSAVTIAGQITGSGGLGVAWDGGTVVLSGANNYLGATTIGTTGNHYYSSSSANPTLQLGSSSALPGTDLIFGTDANNNTATLDLYGNSATVGALTGGANAIVNNSGGGTSTLTVGNNNASSTFSGVLKNTSGTLALSKTGSGTATLAGANTYSGVTTVNSGTLALGANNVLPSVTTVNLVGTGGSGGVLGMNNHNNTVQALEFSGVVKAAGTWGAIGTSANHTNSHFSGTGILTVTTGGTSAITLASNPNPSIYGNALTLTATVTGIGGSGLTPSGTVKFYDGGALLGVGVYQGGTGNVATWTRNVALTEGTHSLTAAYGGDDNYDLSSTAGALTQTVCSPVTASTGGNQAVCVGNSTQPLGGQVGGGATGGIWSSSGTGTFTPNMNTLNAIYTPSSADIAAGAVTLTLTTTGTVSPCSPATAQMVVTITALPLIAPSGEPTNLTVCAGSPAIFTVNAIGLAMTYQWQVSGDGGTTFTNISSTATNASYTNVSPVLADSGNEYQVLIGWRVWFSACNLRARPCLPFACRPLPARAATRRFARAAARCRWAVRWAAAPPAASGRRPARGTFVPDTTTLNAIYAPSADDISAGGVTLTLTAQPCGDATAQVVVTIDQPPSAPATTGDTICGAGTVNLSASGSGGTLTWYSDATLTNVVNTGPTYSVYLASTTTYYVMVISGAGCVSPASPVTGTVLGTSSAYAGPNQCLPAGTATIQLAGSVTGTSEWHLEWRHGHVQPGCDHPERGLYALGARDRGRLLGADPDQRQQPMWRLRDEHDEFHLHLAADVAADRQPIRRHG